ncbi:hypothetical protein P8452_21899 [Trifolium repens]|nr:asparagine synthetase [Trifolium repens]WJX33719.1 hypothetical protein P8452_21899 [Trifolium repens]
MRGKKLTLFSSFTFIYLNLNPQDIHFKFLLDNASQHSERFVVGLGYFGIYFILVCICMNTSAARPEGSRSLDHAASHSTAFAVLHATLGPPGTDNRAEFCSNERVQHSQ